MNANKEVNIIKLTLTMPKMFSFLTTAISGIIKAKKIKSVKTTAICEIALFFFFTPLWQASSNTPIAAGIIEVIEGVGETK